MHAASRKDRATATGVDELLLLPFPSWPLSFKPQHLTAPVATFAHVWLPPLDTPATLFAHLHTVATVLARQPHLIGCDNAVFR